MALYTIPRGPHGGKRADSVTVYKLAKKLQGRKRYASALGVDPNTKYNRAKIRGVVFELTPVPRSRAATIIPKSVHGFNNQLYSINDGKKYDFIYMNFRAGNLCIIRDGEIVDRLPIKVEDFSNE